MSRRSKIQTSIQSAVEYWSRRIDEDEISTDWREADTHCWRGGCQRNLERCHIVPHTLGGTDEPSNIVLLCKRCHREGPNVTDPEIMWDWIRAYRVPFLETFWIIRGQKEYAFIYGKPLYREIQDICSRASVPLDTAQEQFDLLLGEVKRSAGIHFGQPYFNTATIAGLYRMNLKKLAASYGVAFPLEQDEPSPTPPPWWL